MHRVHPADSERVDSGPPKSIEKKHLTLNFRVQAENGVWLPDYIEIDLISLFAYEKYPKNHETLDKMIESNKCVTGRTFIEKKTSGKNMNYTTKE